MSWFGNTSAVCRARAAAIALAAAGVAMSDAAVCAPASDRIDYERLADAPVSSVRFMRLRDWEALDDRTIVLWVGRQEPYLVKLDGRCVGLTFNNTIGVTSFGHRLYAGSDRVLTADGYCSIVSIQPLNYGALQNAKVEMRAGRDVKVRDRTEPEVQGREGGGTDAITVSSGQSEARARRSTN